MHSVEVEARLLRRYCLWWSAKGRRARSSRRARLPRLANSCCLPLICCSRPLQRIRQDDFISQRRVWRACWLAWGRESSSPAHGSAGVLPCVRARHAPLRTALYHTDDLSPSFTSPMTDAVGATKTSSPSCGFAPSYGSTGLCRDTARHTGCLLGQCAGWIGKMGQTASRWGVWIGTHVRF